jgi:hypothetical protein|tara:strand:- start:1334 stop:1435 length:102 start_codon:yes stop_codon:yes gene_type:complete
MVATRLAIFGLFIFAASAVWMWIEMKKLGNENK